MSRKHSPPWLALACALSVSVALQRWLCRSCNSIASVKGGMGAPPRDPDTESPWGTSHPYSLDTHNLAIRRGFLVYFQLWRLNKDANHRVKVILQRLAGQERGTYCDPFVLGSSLLWLALPGFLSPRFHLPRWWCFSTEFYILHSHERKSLARKH